MTEPVVNPWAGRAQGYTDAGHKENGSYGVDYVEDPDVPVLVGVAGWATYLGGSMKQINVTSPAGLVLEYKENKTIRGVFPRVVKIGEQIATTGLVRLGIKRWPHLGARKGTVRGGIEPYVTSTTPAGGGGTVITPEEEDPMKILAIRNDQAGTPFHGEIGTIADGVYRPIKAASDLVWIGAPYGGMPIFAGNPWFGFNATQWEEMIRIHTGHNRAYWAEHWADDGAETVTVLDLSDEDLAKIAVGVKVPTVAEIVAGIVAADDNDTNEILAAIAATPDAFRARLQSALEQ